MRFLAEHDPGGVTSARTVAKRAVDRRRTLLDHRVADKFRAYFREERVHVVQAVADGRDPDAAVDALRDDLLDTFKDAWGGAAREWGAWVAPHVQELARKYRAQGRETAPGGAIGPKGAGGHGAASGVTKADPLSAMVLGWLANFAAQRVVDVVTTTKRRIRDAITAGTAAGETVSELADRLDDLYLDEIIPNRSMVIARTEVGHATNFAQHAMAVDADVPMVKDWMSLRDDRVRDDHAEADGQTVPIDEPFEVGGDQLMFPGDTSLGAGPEELINCRCSVGYRVADPGELETKRKRGSSESDHREVSDGDDAVSSSWAEDDLRGVHDVVKYDPDQARDDRGVEERPIVRGPGHAYIPLLGTGTVSSSFSMMASALIRSDSA